MEITWRCHVCKDERADSRISVRTHQREIRGVRYQENVRYCNDRPSCIEGSKSYTFTRREGRVDGS